MRKRRGEGGREGMGERERGGWNGELREREGRVRKRWEDERCWERRGKREGEWDLR